ncbi:CHAP domain-containing protein [Candidatus Dormibacter sp.]|uniref:CHAP domain-containing protein n=1 Tax=Candidatus Dormibacter sp. TaxID=2973982 RepID=UPI0026AD2C3B
MRFSRYITHVLVLVVALVLSGYASLDHSVTAGVNLRLGAVNAEGLVSGQGGSSGSIALGRAGTIVKPAALPSGAVVSHSAQTYQVADGENLQAVADRFHLTVESIRWSNYATLKSLATDVSAGQSLVVPPVNGVALTVQAGDTPHSLAAAYHADTNVVLDFNYIRGSADAQLAAGSSLVIPGGKGPDFDRPAAGAQAFTPTRPTSASAPAAPPRPASSSAPAVSGPAPAASNWAPTSGNRFAYGYCTWYVYNRKPVPWLGNAREWFGQAQAAGWRTGQTPAPGAIMVTAESGWGHVAYVESVAPDGSWTVSEMNYKGWNIVSGRTIHPGTIPLIGFIYGP